MFKWLFRAAYWNFIAFGPPGAGSRMKVQENGPDCGGSGAGALVGQVSQAAQIQTFVLLKLKKVSGWKWKIIPPRWSGENGGKRQDGQSVWSALIAAVFLSSFSSGGDAMTDVWPTDRPPAGPALVWLKQELTIDWLLPAGGLIVIFQPHCWDLMKWNTIRNWSITLAYTNTANVEGIVSCCHKSLAHM